ncbi:MAG: DNA adenine methylase [Bacteroidaceae bacterium]|nr:DNA adenine methylase [Bacteroidaceae bacterium]
MTESYGLPYMGSKQKIADEIMAVLPPSNTFVDLFAGGCAISHCAMLSGKYRRVVANDIYADVPKMFQTAYNGGYKDETRWISREEFFARKDSDAYIRLMWSFSNNMRSYVYSRSEMLWREALHRARLQDDCSLLRAMGIESNGTKEDIQQHAEEYMAKYNAYCKAKGVDGFVPLTADCSPTGYKPMSGCNASTAFAGAAEANYLCLALVTIRWI